MGFTLEKVFGLIHFGRTPAYWDPTANPSDFILQLYQDATPISLKV